MRKTKTKISTLKKERPTPFLIKALKESEADRKAGRYHTFSTVEGAISYLDKITKKTKNEPKKRT